MKQYRKKPVVIEAVQWDGTIDGCIEVYKILEEGNHEVTLGDGKLKIPTLEGVISASPGDYIVKGIKGEVYPCKPDIFEQTYDEVGAGFTISVSVEEGSIKIHSPEGMSMESVSDILFAAVQSLDLEREALNALGDQALPATEN